MLRYVLVLMMLMMPAATFADDTSTGSNSVQSTGSADSSPQTSGLLQPAATGSTSSLQSADATSGGAAQSGGQNIQQSGTADDAKLLIQGEADAPQKLDAGPNLTWLLTIF